MADEMTFTSEQIEKALREVVETTGQAVKRWRIRVWPNVVEGLTPHTYCLTLILANGEEFVVDQL